MAGSIDLHLNIENSLNENLKSAESSMTGINDMSGKINKNMSEMNTSSNMLNDNYDDIEESAKNSSKWTDKLSAGLNKAAGFAKKIALGFLSFFGVFSLIDTVRSVISLNQEMTDLSYRMGEAGKTVGQLTDAVTGATMATGISIERSQKWVISLREMRVATEDIKELTIAGAQFAEITGASDDAVQKLTGSLYTMGGLGAKEIKKVMGEIVAVQRAFGLSTADVGALTDGITNSVQRLRQLGKSGGEVAKFSSGVTKLAGAFSSVGLEAQTATAMIEKMLDPGAIEENAFLFAKLGVSMDDAINGNIDPEQLVGSFKNLGAELKNMSGPAAAQMAKSLGMPLNQLRQMAEMDMDELKGTFADMGLATGELSQEQKDQQATQDMLSTSMEKFKGLLVDIGSKVMPMINSVLKKINVDKLIGGIKKAVDVVFGFLKGLGGGGGGKIAMVVAGIGVAIWVLFKLLKKRFFSVATDIGKSLSTTLSDGMVEGMEMGAEKGAAKMEVRMKASTSAYAEDLQQRIIQGTEYAALQASATFYDTMSNTNLTGMAKNMAKNTGEWFDTISNGAKPLSIVDGWLKKHNNKQQENIKLSQENSKIRENALGQMKEINQTRKDELDARIKILEEAKGTAAYTTDRKVEYEKLVKLQTKETDKLAKMEKEIQNEQARAQKRQKRHIENMSAEDHKRYAEVVQGELDRGNLEKANIEARQKDNQLTLDSLDQSKKDLAESLVASKELLANNQLSNEERVEAVMLQQRTVEAQKVNNQLLAEENATQSSLAVMEDNNTKALKASRSELELIVNATQNTTLAEYDKLEARKLSLLASKDALDVSSKEAKIIQKEIDDINKLQVGDLAKELGGDKLYSGAAEKVKNIFGTLRRNFVGGMQDGMDKVGDSARLMAGAVKKKFSIKNLKASIAAKGGGNIYKGFAKVLGKGAKKMGGALKAGAKKFGKAMKGFGGPMMLIAGIFIKALKDMDTFKMIFQKVKDVFAKLMVKLEPVLQQMMPIFDDLIEALMPLVDILFKVIGPIMRIIGALFKALAPIMIELVKILLPPLLLVMGYMVKLLGGLITAISNLIIGLAESALIRGDAEEKMLKMGNTMLDLGTSLDGAGDELVATGKEMWEANKNSEFGEFPELVVAAEEQADYTREVADNTDPEAEASVTRELYPAIIEATSSGFVQTEAARETLTGSPEKIQEELARETNLKLEMIADGIAESNIYNAATATATEDLVNKPVSPAPAVL